MTKPVKVIKMILILTIVGTLIGCAGQTTEIASTDENKEEVSTDQITTIKWWCPNWDEEIGKTLVAEFEEENPNIKVEMVITTWDTMQGQIITALNGTNPPDVITDLESRTPGYAQQGLLTNLDSYYESSGINLDDFVASSIPLQQSNGSMYGMPFRHDGHSFIYNKDMFRAAGLDPEAFPTTWEELEVVMKQLTIDANGNNALSTDFDENNIVQYGMGWPLGNEGNAIARVLQLLYTFGGELTNPEVTECALNSDAGYKAIEYLYNNVTDKVVPQSALETDNTGITNLMINKVVAMQLNGAYDLEPIQEGASDIDLGTAMVPGLVEGEPGQTMVNGFNLYIPQNSSNKDAAWKLVEFLGRAENSGRLTTTFPARKSAMTMDKFSDPLLQPFLQQMEYGTSDPTFVQWPAVQKIMFTELQLVLYNGKDINQALVDMCSQIDVALAE